MKRQEKGRGKLDIRVLFTLAAIAEILGTLLIATLLTALLENLLHEAIEVHPLVWLLLFGTTIGLTAATVVNVLLLRPVVRLSRAMKQVASGNFSVRLTTNSVINEIADSYDSFNRMVEALGETETLQTDFVSNVSHEIKTPVSAIEGRCCKARMFRRSRRGISSGFCSTRGVCPHWWATFCCSARSAITRCR